MVHEDEYFYRGYYPAQFHSQLLFSIRYATIDNEMNPYMMRKNKILLPGLQYTTNQI